MEAVGVPRLTRDALLRWTTGQDPAKSVDLEDPNSTRSRRKSRRRRTGRSDSSKTPSSSASSIDLKLDSFNTFGSFSSDKVRAPSLLELDGEIASYNFVPRTPRIDEGRVEWGSD